MYKSGWFSFSRILQAVFWAMSLGFMTHLSLLSFGYPAGMQRVLLVFPCQLLNFYFCYSFLVPRYYEKKKFKQAIAGLFFLLLLLTPARYFIEKQFVSMQEAVAREFLSRRTMPGFIVFSQVAIAIIASLLRLAVSHEKSKSKIIELEKLQLETELRFLKAQTNPHFLFNTINNIYSLSLVKSDLAPQALMKLSALLRYLLYESHGRVMLERETAAVNAFIELYKLRSEGDTDINFINRVSTPGIMVEPHLVIPLLENAFKYSGIGTIPGATVNIEITEDKMLIVKVSNTKAGINVEKDASGIGLANIKKRLQLMYPINHQLNIKEDQNNFCVTLMVPIV